MELRARRYNSGLANPTGWWPWDWKYWSIRAVRAAHTGVASEVPPEESHRPVKRIAAPVCGAASAATG